MDQIFINTAFTINQLIEKIDTGDVGLPELQPFAYSWGMARHKTKAPYISAKGVSFSVEL